MDKFNEIANQIRNEAPEPGATEAAADRVRKNLFGAGSEGAERLRGCLDFRSLFSSYRSRTLSEPRRLLLEDHLKECVACREALHETRSGKLRPMPARRTSWTAPQWAVAAMLMAAVGLTALAGALYLLPAMGGGPRATVALVDGMLYRVTAAGSLPVVAGAEIGANEEIRTAKGSVAVVRLADGSRVEMNERAELSLTRGWRGSTIHLNRGHIIVQAAKQERGRLFVATGDCQVAVKGTIFSVNRGTVGSRVSVVEGQVEVVQAGRTESLKPGQQTTTTPALGRVPVEEEVAWSQDAARYAALLGELQILEKRFESLPGSGLRYGSKLLVYVPEDTKIFAAIPNMGVTLAEAKRVFDERLRASETLREWWNDKRNDGLRQELDLLIDKARELSTYIGEEIVVAIGGAGGDSPLILAEARDGAAGFLERQLAEVKGRRPFEYAVQNGILLVAPGAARLARGKMLVAGGGAPPTPFRSRVAEAYRNGAGWLICANMEQIFPESVQKKGSRGPTAGDLGLDSVQYLVLERRDVAGQTENRAALTFQGERKGIASWLAAPGPMGALDFVSPDAGFAASAVVKSPRAMVEELFGMLRRSSSHFDIDLAQVEHRTGIRVVDDLAAPLGSEFALALDGPLLPTPSWKAAVEVNSPQRLQATIVKLVELANREANPTTGAIALASEQSGTLTFHKITAEKLPWEVHYAFVDSYLAAASSRALLLQAIDQRKTGYTLLRSERFRSRLPAGTNPNLSGLVYYNAAVTLGPLAGKLKDVKQLSEAQRQAIGGLESAEPQLIAVQGEPDRIAVATVGALPGLSLSSLAGLGQFPGLFPGKR